MVIFLKEEHENQKDLFIIFQRTFSLTRNWEYVGHYCLLILRFKELTRLVTVWMVLLLLEDDES